MSRIANPTPAGFAILDKGIFGFAILDMVKLGSLFLTWEVLKDVFITSDGVGHAKPAMVTGGRILVFPGLQTWSRMSLNIMTLEIISPGVYTAQGVPMQVTGVAQVKIASSPCELLELACENFLSKHHEEIMNLIKATLEGHQRGIMGTMSVEDIYKNRKLFNQRVFDVASKDLLSMGITVLSYTIKDLTDDYGYLKVLGLARTAQVMRDARIGEAVAKMEANIRQVQANEELAKHQYSNKTQVAMAERTFMLQKALFDQEVNTEKAVSDFAYQLQETITRQSIREEEMQTRVVERAKKIEIEEEELKRKEKELEASIMKPALAEKYRMETLAEADRKKKVLEAEAKAESIRLKAEAEKDAIMAMAQAESEQMINKAQAWKEYGEAALLQEYLKALPKTASEVGKSLANVKTIKMVSSGSSDVGAAKLTKEVADITSSIPNLVERMTGLELTKKLGSISGKPIASH